MRPFVKWTRLLAASLLVIAGAGAGTGQLRGADAPPLGDGITEPFLDVTLSASVPGIIGAQKFKEGDFVKAGEVILELDKQIEELEARRRQLVMDNRKADWEATETLFKNSKGVSAEEREKKAVDFKIAQTEYEMAAEQLRRRHVIAPLAGVITELFLEVGEACQPYQPLVRVVDTRRCYFVSNIEAKAGAQLQPGQTVRLAIDTGAATVPVTGKVYFLSPVVDPGSGLLKVKVLFENADLKIRPGLAGKLYLN